MNNIALFRLVEYSKEREDIEFNMRLKNIVNTSAENVNRYYKDYNMIKIIVVISSLYIYTNNIFR